MYDFQVVSSETDTSLALRCQWETPGVGRFTYSCHVPDGGSPREYLSSGDTITRGWSTSRGDEGSGEDVVRIQYIWRRQLTPQEGYFSCYNFVTDINDPAGLYILYPSECPCI